ncbi:MAG: MarR family transcriptional regulator [Rhodobacteraceae bacterium]|nr:MarR family transcriptional regulator [Paracoccaceae bacterium]
MQAQDMAGHLIRRLHQLSAQVFQTRTQDAGLDLTPVQFAAMDAVASHPGIDQASVAALIAYDRATIGGVVDRLARKGYLKRVVSRSDRRARELRLTEEGQQAFQAAAPVVRTLQADILANLTAPECDTLLALLRKAIGAEELQR